MWEQTKIPLKFQILGFIAEQGVVSIEDINRHFYPDRDNSKALRVIFYDMGLAHLRYSETKNGVWFIDKPKLYDLVSMWFPRLPLFKVRPPSLHLIAHYLELNRIRTTFERSDEITIDEWWSEHYIRALHPLIRSHYSDPKIPDAIFWRRRKDGTRQQLFLEYERTLKSRERYKEIFRAYSRREDVKDQNVIYLCRDAALARKIINIEWRLARIGLLDIDGRNFKFIVLENFYNAYSKKVFKGEEQAAEDASRMATTKGVEHGETVSQCG